LVEAVLRSDDLKSRKNTVGEACPFVNTHLKGGFAMRNNNSVYAAGMLATLALALVGAGAAGRVAAQDLVKAKFTLTSKTRFGATVLPAGQYTLFVEPISSVRAVGSPVAVTVRSENGSGPHVSVLVTASQEGCGKDELKLNASDTGFVAQSMCLGTQQLMLHFDGSRSGNLL
jgi:hypothetical protein